MSKGELLEEELATHQESFSTSLVKDSTISAGEDIFKSYRIRDAMWLLALLLIVFVWFC